MGIFYEALHDKEKEQQFKNEMENIAFDYATLPELQVRNQSDEVRNRLLNDAIEVGEIREPDSGFWGEMKDDFLLSSNRAMRGIANTFGSEDGVKYFDEVLEDNPRWLPPEERGALGSIGGAIGSGLGSTAVTLPGMVAGGIVGTAVGGPVGTFAGFALPFLNTMAISFGDTVDRNIANGLTGTAAWGEAVIESGLTSAVETALGTVPALGKMLKGVPTAGLAAKTLSALQSKLGKNGAKRFIYNVGKNMLGNSIEEGTEEAIQYLIETAGDAITESIGKDKDFYDTLGNKISAKDWWNNAWQGAVAGLALGAAPAIGDANRSRQYSNLRNAAREGRVFHPAKGVWEILPESANTPNSTEAAAPETAPAQTPAPVQQIADGDFYTPLTQEEKEAVARLDAIETEEGISSEAERLGIKLDPSMHEQGKYDAVRKETIRQIRAAKAQAEAEAATVQTPVTPSNTAVEAAPEIETGGQGTLAFGSPETAPAVAENTADETAPVPAPAVPAVDIPDVQSPMDIAQTEINTQAMENQQIRADEEAEALANEIESEIRQQEEEDAIFDDYESGNYSDNQLAYAPESKANIATPSTAELDAEEKISALKKAESDLNSMRERVAERQGEAPETMESVKISEFDQSKIADKTMQRNLKLAQRIFDALGMGKVVTVETSKEGAFFGVTIRRKNAADNYTFLNMSDIKNNPALLFNRAMHELIHDLIGNNKKAYNELRDKIISPLKGESWFDSSLKEYAEGRGFDLSIPEHKAACEEEFICDTVADLMQTEMFWQTLAEKDLPLCKKILEALKDLLTKVQKSFGKVPDKVSAEFTRQLKNRIELAQKFITEASGKSKADLLSAVMPEETTQVASAETEQKKTEVVSKTENTAPSEVSDNAPQTEQTTEKTSTPSTPSVPSEPQAKETSGEQVSDRKAADYEQRFGTVINTDNAKLLFKDDGYNPHDAESVKKFHSQASAIVRKLFDKFLKERKGKGNGLVVFTGGGNGSGKSSVMADEKIKNSDFVFDSAMVNYEAAKNSIQQVISNGQTPLLAFAYRNPADAWFNGVQKRNQSADGHIVPEGVFANTHAVAKETFLKLVRDFGDKVQYIIKEVADGKVSDISLEELENKPKYTKEQIKESINAENYEKARSILDGFSNQGTDNQRHSADGRSSRGGNRGVHEESSTGISGTVKPPESTISKITSSPVGSNTRIMAFTELADGEHTVNGKTFTKKGNAFTLDGKELNAREIEKATRTKTEKIKAKPKAEEKPSDQSEVSDKSERIEDYGEKIGGARKDIIRQYADKINLNGATFAKMFPKPDYAKLLEAGIKIDVLAKLKTSYDMAKVSVKLHKTLDGRQNLTPAKFYASYAKAALLGEDSVDFTAHNWHFTEFGKQTVTIRSKAMEQLFKELGVEYANVDLKGFDIIDTWWKNGVKPEIPKRILFPGEKEQLEKRYHVNAIYAKTELFDKLEDAIKYFIELVKKHTTLDKPKYKIKMYKAISGEHSGEHYITAAIRGFGDVPLQYFKTYKEASSYWHDHADDLQHQAAEMEEQKKAERSSKFKSKDKPLRLRFNTETLRDRVGIDYRNGKDVSVKEFSEKFNFRAVEFGNSVSQKERQIALNALYDSLLDLAALLDISPEAISLNGKLAFAYGARGVGNAEAHYEPEKNVINLTKTRGAGNVAHEWWHALDYYFADSKNNPAMDGKYRDGIRPEIKKIFEELQKLFSGNSEYVIRAERLDAFTKKNYYTQPTEMAARAFADYVSRQLESQGQINDFLSNHVSETDWKGEENTYPYPTGDDAVKIGDTFQSLFNTIDEKVDESGNTALFSTVGDLQTEQYADRMAEIEAEMRQLKKKYEGTAQWMKAPNGKHTNLTEFQWLQVRTKAFKQWFGDWENDPENASKVVDENGEPLVVYHGSSADFTVFDHRFGYRNGAAEGRGFYFTSDKSKAEGYKTENGKLFEVYLRLQKPLDPDVLTITKAEVEKIVRAIDTDGIYVSDYAENDIGYPGKIWYNKAVKSAVNAIYNSSDNNADIVAEIYSVFGQGDALSKITEATGYDGFVNGDVYVVFNPTQIKSATDNIGTFDGTNPDIRYSLINDLGDTSLSPMDYRRSIDPLFNFVMEYTDNGIVNPGKEHEGEYFTGSFISREYIAYSEKKPQGKNQSDKQYQQYLERREQALDNAEGTPLDEIAAAYVRKFGGDEKEISEQILDMLRDLTKRDLISDRAEAKREVAEHEKEQRKEDDAEWKKMKEDSLTEKVNELFESKEPVTVDKRWVQMHREIYPKLYKTVFPNAENVPDIPSSREMAIINEALSNGKMSEAAKVAEPLLTDKNLEVKEEADNIEKSIIMRIIELISPKLANSLRDPNEKKDINLVDMLLRPPKWIAEKLKDLPAVQALYQATQDFLDDKAKIANYLNDGLIDKLVNLQKEDKAEYKKCNDYLLKSDRDQTGAGRVKGNKEGLFYIATTADGVSIGSFKTEDEAFDELFKNEHDEIIAKGIMSEKAADAALEFRRAMRRTFVFRRDNIFRTLRQLGFTDVNSTSFIIENPQAYFPDTDITGRVDLFELMREMGQRSGYYVPRIRHGRYMFKATKAGEPTILKGFDTEIGRAWERLKLEKQGYKVKNFLSNTPDQSMMQQVDPAAMMDIMNQAQIRADEKLKNDLTLKEEIYTRKDGTKEKHLVLSPKAKPSTQTVIMLKSIGAKYIDDSWHIINADLQTRANIEEILKGQALHESKLQIAMQSAIGASLVDMIRETGAGSSKIQRRTAKGDDVARGYEEDLIKISGLYINGVSGSTAKNIMAKKMYSAFGGMCFDREKYITDLIPEGLEIGTAEYEKARLNATAEYYKEVSRLAINSAKQPQLAKYFDGYIKEMLRNTTGLERILGGVKGVSAIWLLTRPSSAISNLVTAVATTPATVHAKTGCGIGFAVKQTGIGAKLYAQYFNWGKYGEGTNLPPQTRELFDIIHKNGWDGAELTNSATQAGLTFAGKAWSKTAYGALWMFSHAEQVNRAAAIYAAYQALVKQRNIDESKLSAMDKYRLLKEAKSISDFGNGVYNKGNRLAITRGGGWGAVVDTGLLFKTFSVNLYNNMYNMLVTGNIKSLAYMTTVLMLAGGASSSIIGTLLASMLGAFSADEGEEKDEAFYRWFADKTYPYFSNIVKYGVPAAININLSGTFRDDIVDAMHDGLPDGNINFTELPAFAIYRNLKNAIEYANSGQSMKAVEQTLPSWGASIARAVREANDGITDRQGKKRKDIHDEYIEADGWDTVARILSFNPVAVSEKTDRIWSEKKVREKYSQMRKDIVEDYRAIIFDGNPSNEDLADIALRIEEYNAKARRSKRNVPFIDAATLNNAVKDKDNKFLKDDLDEKDKKRIEKKSKGKIVIRNGKLVKE